MTLFSKIKATKIYKALRKLYLSTLSDEAYFLRRHKSAFGYTPDFKNPQTFNEKIVHRILYDRNPIYTLLADKLKARIYIASKLLDPSLSVNKDFLAQTGGSESVLQKGMPIYKPINEIEELLYTTNLCEYLPKLYGIWDSVDQIDFDSLPNSFVLKTNHDCGGVIIVKEKNLFLKDTKLFKSSIHKLTKHLKTNWYPIHREYHYKDIEPKIFAEEFLSKPNGRPLDDYKTHVFLDKILFSIVADRGPNARCTFFDEEWNTLPLEVAYSKIIHSIEKPARFDLMKMICKKFYIDTGYARIDFYLKDTSLFIGEITFTPFGGYMPISPREWDKKLGEMWK